MVNETIVGGNQIAMLKHNLLEKKINIYEKTIN